MYALLLFWFCLLPAVLGGDGVLRQMWVTPIKTENILGPTSLYSVAPVSLAGSTKILSPKRLISELSKAVWSSFQEFGSNEPLVQNIREQFDLHEDASLSDVFFYHQQFLASILSNPSKYGEQAVSMIGPADQKMYSLFRAFASRIIRPAVEAFLQDINVADDGVSVLDNLDRNASALFVWASVHINGSSHPAHHHLKSAVSGVLYVQIPPLSGAIVFEDPRGSLPPFGKTFRFSPTVGDLVLFPGWLVHRVEASRTFTLPRISVSFNVDGNWETSSDVNLGFRT